MSSLRESQAINDRVRRSVEAQRDILMDILNRHFNDTPHKSKNEDESKMERQKEDRRSTTGKVTTTKNSASRATNVTASKATSKTTTSRESGSGRREKLGHLRILSQDSNTTIDLPPAPLSKSADLKSQDVARMSSQRQSLHTQSEVHVNQTRPTRPHQDSEAPFLHQPSCTGLPPIWNATHDKFIAYLATHAPLDRHGKVPKKEEVRERWGVEDIVSLIERRFRGLGVIKATAIEMRLQLLDESGDNDYFQKTYGAYRDMEWGRGI